MHESEKWKWSRSVVSDSQRPHGLQPTRLLCPWDFPGKSTGVGALWSRTMLNLFALPNSLHLKLTPGIGIFSKDKPFRFLQFIFASESGPLVEADSSWKPAVSIWADRLWWPVPRVTNWLLRKWAIFWGLDIFRAKPKNVLGQLQRVGHLTWTHIVQKLCFFVLLPCNKTLMDLFNRFSYYWNCNAMLSCFSRVRPMDYSPPGSSARGILQGKILEWVAIPFSKDLPNLGIKPMSLRLLHWQVGSLPLVPPGKPITGTSHS